MLENKNEYNVAKRAGSQENPTNDKRRGLYTKIPVKCYTQLVVRNHYFVLFIKDFLIFIMWCNENFVRAEHFPVKNFEGIAKLHKLFPV